MKIRGALLLILVTLAGACAKQVDQPAVQATYATAKPTVATLADASFTLLALPSKKNFEIDASSPAFDFGTQGVSYFRAFELPRSDRPYAVTVASYMWNGANRPRGFFYQAVMALDRDKRPIGAIKPAAASWVLQPDLPPHRDIVLELTPNMKARYIVVYTTRDLIQNSDEHVETVGAGILPLMTPQGPTSYIEVKGHPGNLHMPGMPTGSLSVEVKQAE